MDLTKKITNTWKYKNITSNFLISGSGALVALEALLIIFSINLLMEGKSFSSENNIDLVKYIFLKLRILVQQ